MDPQVSSLLPPWIRAGLPSAVFLFSFLAFTPALGGEFLNWDDNLVLTDHNAWRGLGWDQIGWAFSTHHAGHFHPLTWLSFGLDYSLWGMNPWGYHLVNLLLHATGAVLFYFIVLRLLDRTLREDLTRLAAAAGALLFAIHPLRVESVAWITERRDVLSGCLLLLTVLAWLKWTGGEGRKWYAIALGAFILSLLSKAWGITLPIVLLILDLYPLRRFIAGRRAAVLLETTPFFALAIAAGVAAFIAQRRVGAMDFVPDHTAIDRVIQSGYGLFFYVAKTVAPVAQNPLYALKPSFNPFEAKYVLGAAAAALITVAAILLRKRRPELLTAWLIFAVSVGPVLGLAQAGPQLVAEKYTYLSCLPFAVLATAGLVAWMARDPKTPLVVVGLLIAVLGIRAWSYSHEWRDSVSLWTRAVRQDDENTQAWFNLGSAKLKRGDRTGAFSDLGRAIELNPKYASAYLNRGNARMDRDPAGALQDYEAAIRIIPDYADAFANRGLAKFALGDHDGGVADLDRALQLDQGHYRALVNRAVARIKKRDFKTAREDLDKAIRMSPAEPDGWYFRAIARGEDGDVHGAIEDCARALSIAPSDWVHRAGAESLIARARQRKAGN